VPKVLYKQDATVGLVAYGRYQMMKRLLAVLAVSACNLNCDQYVTRQFGGTSTFTLDPCHKLINVTWKLNDIWVLTRTYRPDETSDTYEFFESSAYGVFNGKVIIKEQNCPKPNG
jgi:hypothetical protein